MKGANATYFGNILEGFTSSIAGIKLTLKHLFQALQKRKPIGIADDNYFSRQTGIVTLQYPQESFPVPDNGRYRLYNEIDDCIVCDLCAKICPVNCIEIEPIKATEEIGKTSDGTTKRIYAAKFDIDMAKCCYCGLCTTVCPTECLTMTKTYDYSEFDVRNMVYHFTDLSPETASEKQKLLEEFQKAAKIKVAPSPEAENVINKSEEISEKKPAFKPIIKAPAIKKEDESIRSENVDEKPKSKPVFKPVIKKPAAPLSPANADKEEGDTSKNSKDANLKLPSVSEETITPDAQPEKPKQAPKPIFKPVIKTSAVKKPGDAEIIKKENSTLSDTKESDKETKIVNAVENADYGAEISSINPGEFEGEATDNSKSKTENSDKEIKAIKPLDSDLTQLKPEEPKADDGVNLTPGT